MSELAAGALDEKDPLVNHADALQKTILEETNRQRLFWIHGFLMGVLNVIEERLPELKQTRPP